MQYENNVRKKKFTEKKTNKIWFSKSLFPKGTSGKTGSSYIRVNMVIIKSYILQQMWKLNGKRKKNMFTYH